MPTPLKMKKTPKFVPLHTSVSFASRAVLTVRNQPKTLRGMFHQMDHTWWAPNRLKKSPRFKMRSQLSLTLFHSFIVTLYVQTICTQTKTLPVALLELLSWLKQTCHHRFTVQVYTKPVYCKIVHKTSLLYKCTKTSLLYKCTQNQFTVQVYTKPV